MKKLIALTLLLCTFALLLSSCGSRNAVKIEKPEDTNLEYWLLDSPNKKEWTKLYGDILSSTYLANGYEAVLNESDNLVYPPKHAPEHAVVYFTENYPIEEIGIKKITGIYITDPEIYVWGLTVNSTREEVVEVMEKMGFEERHLGPNIYSGLNGRYKVIFRFDSKTIEINYCSFGIIENMFASYYYN
ncbi:MAG: hypothetical protein IKA84_01715 [Clostridia bacterium]|nr:hypothetical protein [Clostridia bacterium]